MTVSSLALGLIMITAASGQNVNPKELEHAKTFYRQCWGTDMIWKFDELPEKGTVPASRVPYSGYIYPDLGGGTVHALQKYDRAFNRGRYSASAHERWDTSAYQQPTQVQERGGLFGMRMRSVTRMQTPTWYGHCNGWAAAAIRHAEPQHSVVRNGVTFRPADIKGLLAEIYIYSESEMIAGAYDYVVNPATLHVSLANWLGRQSHPVAMESTPGTERWNYPVYSYAYAYARRGSKNVEVKLTIGYIHSSDSEYDKSPRIKRKKYFHYALNLDDAGNVTGGSYYGDSSRIDLLWIPLPPVQGGTEGNERGNPYVNVQEVLKLWQDSVSPETIARWVNVDPKHEMTVAENDDGDTSAAPGNGDLHAAEDGGTNDLSATLAQPSEDAGGE